MYSAPGAYELKRRAISLIAPNRCPFCRDLIPAADFWCGECYRHLPFIYGIVPAPENVSRMLVCCYYRHRARSAVLWLKYGGVLYPADAFARMMSERISESGIGADMLVPVPSGYLSVRKRGFPPAKVIAKRVSALLGLPMVCAVRAAADKTEQKLLSDKGRRENARKSFCLSRSAGAVKGKRVLLIDDVSTTGSTLSAVAKLLLDHGASEVNAAVFAKARRITPTVSSRGKYKIHRG